ncbi:unnamed protein product [Symbiodinium sp. KB8]|nr:unnamed protein product [Symbiodinium sp. KB8]
MAMMRPRDIASIDLMSLVLGHSKRKALLEETDSETTRRSQESSESDSDGSEANEYAEGLGYADQKRCCQKSTSQFEFDHHPKEEYFEQPKSYQDDDSRCLELPVLGSSDGSRALPSVLNELEVREAIKDDASFACVSNWLADSPSAPGMLSVSFSEERCAKRRRLRAQRGQSAPGQAPAPVPAAAACRSADPTPEAGLKQIRAYSACLSVLRQSQENTFDEEESLRILNALGSQKIGKAELKGTGIGRELAKAFWQRHRSAAVARLARGLVDSWRQSLRPRV